MKPHEDEDLVWEYVDGALDGERRAMFERHAADCAGCARTLAASRALDRMLAAELESPRAPDSLAPRVIARARADAVSRRGVGWLAWLDLAGFAALAAAGLLAARALLSTFGLPPLPSGSALVLSVTSGGALVAFWAALTVAFDFRLSAC